MTEPSKFAVVFEKSANGFGAYVPDLPGCVAVADTLEETQALIHEGIEIYLEELREDGAPIPRPSAFRVEFIEVPQQFAKAS